MLTNFNSTVQKKFARIVRRLIEQNRRIATMESCTGGLLASLLTDTEGASAIFRGGFVTYSNEAKVAAGVPAETIDAYGVYSQPTADAMASACRAAFGADFGVGITGSFGNTDPANADSVPGEVYFAIEHQKGTARFHDTVPPQPSRLDYKLYMADRVADRLLEIIG